MSAKILIEAYLDLLLGSALNVMAILRYTNSTSDFLEWFDGADNFLNTVMVFIILSSVIIIPFYIRIRINRNHGALHKPEIRDKLGVYFSDFKVKTKTTAQYEVIMIIRRMMVIFCLLMFEK